MIRQLLREQLNQHRIFYHGTKSVIPFQSFNILLDGSGIVSNGGKKYGGFFFTSNYENAEYYTEWFVLSVKIVNVEPDPTGKRHPPTTLQQAIKDNKIYLVEDVLDGSAFSDVVVVPASQLNNVQINHWEFVGDEESYFETLDEYFNSEDDFINQDMISDLFEMTGGGLDYALANPIFKKYFDSKQ